MFDRGVCRSANFDRTIQKTEKVLSMVVPTNSLASLKKFGNPTAFSPMALSDDNPAHLDLS